MVAVAELQECASLEGDAVVAGAIEVCVGVEVLLLLWLEAFQGVASQLYECFCVGGVAADACGGDVVCLCCESVLVEVVAPCGYESVVLCIDVAHEEPCSDAVVLDGCVVLCEECFVVFQQGLCLLVAVALACAHVHCPDVFVAVVPYDGGAELVCLVCDLCAALQVEPEGDFAAVEWWLLYVGDGAGGCLLHEGLLVGGVGEEVSFQYGLCLCHAFVCHELCFGFAEPVVLLLECLVAWFDVQHGVPFCHLTLWWCEGCQFDADSELVQGDFLVLHGALC